MDDRPDVPADILERLRAICLALPEVREEAAWVGTRWRVRRRTFANVLPIESGWPPAYAKAARLAGPATALTFRSSGEELDVLRHADHPFFAPPWGPDVVGLVLEDGVDWDEVTELLTESFRVMAPRSLAEAIPRR